MIAARNKAGANAPPDLTHFVLTPYSIGFCAICVPGQAAWEEGLAFVLESGHENNPEAEQNFHTVRQLHKLERALRSICFVPFRSFIRSGLAADVDEAPVTRAIC